MSMRALVIAVALGSLAVVALACEKQTTPPSPGSPSPSASSPPAVPVDPACGTRPGDWCPSPAGDACGMHKNVEECRADAKCKGMPYKGESLVACKDDGTGFAKNCPTVGCISR